MRLARSISQLLLVLLRSQVTFGLENVGRLTDLTKNFTVKLIGADELRIPFSDQESDLYDTLLKCLKETNSKPATEQEIQPCKKGDVKTSSNETDKLRKTCFRFMDKPKGWLLGVHVADCLEEQNFLRIPSRDIQHNYKKTVEASNTNVGDAFWFGYHKAHRLVSGHASIKGAEYKQSVRILAQKIDDYVASQTTDDNYITSPLSIHVIAEMIFLGTDFSSTSSKQLYKYLGYPTTSQDRAMKDVQDMLKDVANLNTYVYTKTPLNKKFSTEIEDKFKAVVKQVNTLSGQEGALNKIIEDNTDGEIKDFFENGAFTSDTMAVLLNTILFKENWDITFDGKTRASKWYGTEKKSKVNYMSTKVVGKYKMYKAWDGDLSTTYLQLKFKNGYIMTVVMPTEYSDTGVKNVKDFKKQAHEYKFEDVRAVKNKFRTSKTFVLFPKFDFQYELDVKNAMQAAGVTDMFKSGSAKLNTMFQAANNFHVSTFKHKATIKVDEKGAKATAVSAATVVNKSLPSQLRINKPFRIFIHDKDMEILLFSGVVRNPTQA